MGRNVSALIKKPMATIPGKCIIGSNRSENAILDLRTSVNVMHLSVFTSLCLGPLKPTGVIIQLIAN